MRIGVLSDTHGYLDDRVFDYFSSCDEIWHAGDIGDIAITDRLDSFTKLRAVYGNIDGSEIRKSFPVELSFDADGLRVFMTHIGGAPPRYAKGIKPKLRNLCPDIFVAGHSHILKIKRDDGLGGLLYLNPGSAGIQGIHKIKTLIRFEIVKKKIRNMQVIELGKRGTIN